MARIDAFLEIGRQQGGSDIHFAVGLPPLVRLDSELVPIPYRGLHGQGCTELVREIVDDVRWDPCRKLGAVDLSYESETSGRFRINVFHRRGGISAICRIIPEQVPSMADLGLPRVLSQFGRLS